MTRRQVATTLTAALLCAGLLVPLAGPASATPAAEAKALGELQQQWGTLSMQQKLGTCNAYRRNPSVMIRTATTGMWTRPAAHKGMTVAGWARTYKKYFAWACSGAGRSPRP